MARTRPRMAGFAVSCNQVLASALKTMLLAPSTNTMPSAVKKLGARLRADRAPTTCPAGPRFDPIDSTTLLTHAALLFAVVHVLFEEGLVAPPAPQNLPVGMGAPLRGNAAEVVGDLIEAAGHRLDWMLKATKYGADALILDLEDAAPSGQKAHARATVAEAIDQLRSQQVPLWVRVNGWRTGEMIADLDSVVRIGLHGVMLPKVEAVADVAALDLALSDLESARGLPMGAIEISPVEETASGMYHMYDICMASPRVKRAGWVGFASQEGGDMHRALGVTVNEMADESISYGVHSLRAARAAGITQTFGLMPQKIDDLDLARRLAMRSRRMGATCSTAIHPSHVPIINECYSPSPEEIDRARWAIIGFAEAVELGESAINLEGTLIDYAHVRSAIEVVKMARAVGVDVGPLPIIDLP
jgi:citrate lyase subunit beta / citryl-CoA lyase